MNRKNLFSQIMLVTLLTAFFIEPVLTKADVNCSYRRLAVAEGWAHGNDEYWHIVPVNEKSVFIAGEKVQFFAQAGPLYSWHQWRMVLYKKGVQFREITGDPLYPDPTYGWHYSNFFPYMTDLPINDYQVDYYLNTGSGSTKLGSVTFRVVAPSITYTFHHAITAGGWQYGTGSDYWNLTPVNQKSEFNTGEKVYLLVQTRNIYIDHRYKVELYNGNSKLWEYATDWFDVGGGWVYSNFYPYYENARPGNYNFKTYIDVGQGWQLLATVPFSVKGSCEQYQYHHTTLATGWTYGAGDEYWNLQPVNPKTAFKAGERVYALAQVRNITVNHRWKADLYRSGQKLWTYESPWLDVGGGWNYGNFYPFYDNARVGSYEFKIYIDTGSGYVLLDTKPFTVEGQGSDYAYAGATVAAGWRYGDGADYWNIQPVDARTAFRKGENVYLVAQARNVYVNHRWKIETYRGGTLQWSFITDWFDVGSGWPYSNFYPSNNNSVPGSYEFKLYIDVGNGFTQLDTKTFTVSGCTNQAGDAAGGESAACI